MIDNITQARAENIMSGWRAIFGVYALAGSDNHDSLNNLAFMAVDRIYINHWNIAKESFVDLVKCLAAFAKNKMFTRTALLSIARIRDVAERHVEETQFKARKIRGKVVFTDAKKDTAIWWPILTSLAHSTMDERQEIRNASMTALFKILNNHGQFFSSELWELVFKGVLFPIFDDVRHSYEIPSGGFSDADESSSSKLTNQDLHAVNQRVDDWLKSTCQDALNGVVGLFFQPESFQALDFLLRDVLQL